MEYLLFTGLKKIDEFTKKVYYTPMDKPNNKQDIGEKIYYSGIEIFQTVGYSEANIRSICQNAGVSLGSFYNYYKDKRELYFKIYSNEYKNLSNRFIDALVKNETRGLENLEVMEDVLLTHLNNYRRTILFYIESEVLAVKFKELLELKKSITKEALDILGKVLGPKSRKDLDLETGLPLLYNLVESAIRFSLSRPKEEYKILIKETARTVVKFLF